MCCCRLPHEPEDRRKKLPEDRGKLPEEEESLEGPFTREGTRETTEATTGTAVGESAPQHSTRSRRGSVERTETVRKSGEEGENEVSETLGVLPE